MKTCKDFLGAPYCCRNCHEDADEFWPNYPLYEIEKDGKIVAEVCCAVKEYAWKEIKKNDLAQKGEK